LTIPRLLRLLVAVGLTAAVLYKADVSAMLRVAAGADWRWIGAAIALVLVDRTVMAMRWLDLLVALTPGSRPRFWIVLRIFFVSSFVSNFVPSVAADLYRAYALARHDVHLAESTASVLMDRMLGVLSMVIVGLSALPFASDAAIRHGMLMALGLALAVCATGGAIVFSERAAQLVVRAAALVPWPALHRMTAALTDAVRRYASHHDAMVRVLVLSVMAQVLRVVQAWCLGRAVGIDLSLPIYFALVPVILLIMQIPITVNGLGTTQWAFDRLFVPAGASAPQAVALSVLFLALGAIGTLPGGLLYATGRRDHPPQGRVA
jgi:hypothetical protein